MVRITSTLGFPCMAADDLRDAIPYGILCNNSDIFQQWYYYPEFQSIRSHRGFCLAVRGSTDSSILSTPVCDYSNPNQQWQLAIGRHTAIRSMLGDCIATIDGDISLDSCGLSGIETEWIALLLEGGITRPFIRRHQCPFSADQNSYSPARDPPYVLPSSCKQT